MHVLMTGGTGLIGAATVTALKEKGATVTVLTRRPPADAPVSNTSHRSRNAKARLMR